MTLSLIIILAHQKIIIFLCWIFFLFLYDFRNTDWKDRTAQAYVINFLGIFVVVFVVLVIYLVTKPDYCRPPAPEEDHIQLAEWKYCVFVLITQKPVMSHVEQRHTSRLSLLHHIVGTLMSGFSYPIFRIIFAVSLFSIACCDFKLYYTLFSHFVKL